MLEVPIGGARRARVAYRLDDVAILPTRRTRAREDVDVSWTLDAYHFELPLVSAPLDAATSPTTAAAVADLGGVGVLNLEGLWTRYADPADVLAEIAGLEPGPAATARLQEIYATPVDEGLISRRVAELKDTVGFAAGALSPGKVGRYHHAALEAGLDLLVVHGVVVTAQHLGGEPDAEPLDLKAFTARYDIPVVVGGVASGKSAMHLMRTGAVGVLVGLGAGSASTTAASLGIATGLASALAEVAAARSRYLELSGRYVEIIATGGIHTGGDIAKAVACGADAVMLGQPLACATEAPGGGAYWGLSAAHHELPRGSYRRVETLGTLRQIVEGPAHRDDGTVNLFGGLRRAMAVVGAADLAGLRRADLVVTSSHTPDG